MRPINIDFDLADTDPNGVFEDQTLGGAGNFSLDGAQVTSGTWTAPDGFPRQISFESTGNISAVTFTITGYLDSSENILVTEEVTGPNSSTVKSSNYFYSISQIAADGAVATNTEAGPIDDAATDIIVLDQYKGSVAIGVTVTGTINYTIQQTFDDLQNATAPFNWGNIDDTDLVGATASQTTQYDAVPRGIRIITNSYSSGAELQIGIAQQDV